MAKATEKDIEVLTGLENAENKKEKSRDNNVSAQKHFRFRYAGRNKAD